MSDAPPPRNPDRIERLVRATPQLIAELNHERVLRQVAELARELLEAKYAAVGLLSLDNTTLLSFTTSGLSSEEHQRIGDPPRGHGILGLVIREGRVVRLKDLMQHPASVGFPPNHPPMHSFLGVPIVGREGVLGDLYLTEKIDAEEFSDEDVHIAMLLASIVASAVENARFHERTTRLLEEVQELQRSRERFFAMVNHELRNSLAAVFGWAEMLVRRKEPQNVPRGAFEILEAAEQSVALVNDLLDLNRLDEDRLRPVFKDVDVIGVIHASLQRVTPGATEKNITLSGPPSRRPLLCRTDAHRCEQVLVNLLTNALRHSPPNSTVTASAEQIGDIVVIRVRDEGPGVADEHVDRIFDIYYTSSDRAGGPGHGVGLALSRRLARLLGGDLVVRPGPGAEFLFTLPPVGS